MIEDYIKLIRAHHYVKNLMIFFPCFFAGSIYQIVQSTDVFEAFLSFCLVASFIYILNDLRDMEADKLHPTKSKRPLASGKIKPVNAILIGLVLLSLGLSLAFHVNSQVLTLICIYLIMNIAYSLGLKNIAILDVFIVALGFVLRILVGGAASNLLISKWLIITTFLLSLGLVLGKRYDDIVLTNKNISSDIRSVTKKYNLEFIRNALVMVFTLATMCYIIYSIDPLIEQKFESHYFYTTSLPVVLGVFRYFAIVFIENKSASPVKIALRDKFILACLFIWASMFLYFIYL